MYVVVQDKGIIVFKGNTTVMHNRASYMGAGAYGGVAGMYVPSSSPAKSLVCTVVMISKFVSNREVASLLGGLLHLSTVLSSSCMALHFHPSHVMTLASHGGTS
jgi:hypothetical protein